MKHNTITKHTVVICFFLTACFTSSCILQKQNNNSQKENKMKKILIVGMNPHTIDFSNPELLPNLNIEIIEKGTNATVEKLISMGYDAETFLIDTGSTNLNNLANHLKLKNYDGIVIGNGIRSIKSNFILFEQIVNVVHSNALHAKIIFNSLPTNTDEAVNRWFDNNKK